MNIIIEVPDDQINLNVAVKVFNPNLTQANKDEIIDNYRQLKAQNVKQPRLYAIKKIYEKHFPDEFDKHERFKDWNKCAVTGNKIAG
jgi:hypothetical protein